MEKLSSKRLLNIVTSCILIFVPLFLNGSFYLQKIKLIKYHSSINSGIVLYICSFLLLIIYIEDIISNKRKLDIYDYIFYVLCATGIISVIFSMNKSMAIFGNSARHEGFLSILCYYLLFINYKVNSTLEDVKKYLKIIVIIGIINSIYALFQIYTSFNFIIRFGKMASGFCGNPNFFGSLIVTCLGIMLSKQFMDKKLLIRDILITILLFISLINCQSTGPFLAFVVTVLFLIIFLYKKKSIIFKNVLIISIVLLITYFGVFTINRKVYSIKNCELCASGIKKTIDSGGTKRLEIWKNSLGIVKKYPITGVGFDNFHFAYPNEIPPGSVVFYLSTPNEEQKKKILVFDNAHNVYLHTLVTTGILGFIPYMLLLFLVFLKGLKSKDRLSFILLGGFIAYSTQAFTNISVIQVAPIYYIIIGLILSIKE